MPVSVVCEVSPSLICVVFSPLSFVCTSFSPLHSATRRKRRKAAYCGCLFAFFGILCWTYLNMSCALGSRISLHTGNSTTPKRKTSRFHCFKKKFPSSFFDAPVCVVSSWRRSHGSPPAGLFFFTEEEDSQSTTPPPLVSTGVL